MQIKHDRDVVHFDKTKLIFDWWRNCWKKCI